MKQKETTLNENVNWIPHIMASFTQKLLLHPTKQTAQRGYSSFLTKLMAKKTSKLRNQVKTKQGWARDHPQSTGLPICLPCIFWEWVLWAEQAQSSIWLQRYIRQDRQSEHIFSDKLSSSL